VKKSLLVTALIWIFAIATALAQGAPAADPPATRDDILKLFDVMQVKQQMRSVMDAMMKQQTDLMHQTIRKRYPQASSAKIAEFDRIMQESMKDFPVDELLDDMIPIYARHLTKTDAEAMSTFYASPTGQKLLHEMPAMTSEAMQVAYARIDKQMDAMTRRLEEMEKQDRPATKPAPKSQPPSKPPSQ
jgi:uncharacterized protein